MATQKIDVKSTGGPFNLSRADKWSSEDQEFLIDNGATVNQVGYLHIPLDKIEGEVLLGIGQHQPKGEARPELFIGGRKIKTGKRPFVY